MFSDIMAADKDVFRHDKATDKDVFRHDKYFVFDSWYDCLQKWMKLPVKTADESVFRK